MSRGFLSEGSRKRSSGDEDVTVDLELGWSTEKAFGFRDPFQKGEPNRTGGARQALIWVPREIRGQPLQWTGGLHAGATGKLKAARWLLEQKGLI